MDKSPCCDADSIDVDCEYCEMSGVAPDLENPGEEIECPCCYGEGHLIDQFECTNCGETFNP